MPFDPLPEPLSGDRARLARRTGGGGLDLGCGDSRLANRLSASGLPVWGLDRMPGGSASVIAEATRLPVTEGGLDLIVAANLVRHLLAAHPEAGFLEHWWSSLRSGGVLYILEDQPDLSTAPRRNYHDLQVFLAALWGTGRGPLMGDQVLRPVIARALPVADLQWGRLTNRRRPDAGAVLELLDRGTGSGRGEVGRLRDSIERHGLDYGPYWWLRVQKRED